MSLVGIRSEPFQFVVERSKVVEFARAVFDPGAGNEDPHVPPTFPMYGVADFERHFFFDVLHLDRMRTLNGGQEYVYHRPLRIGDRLECRGRVSEEYDKQGGRGGNMHFIVIEIEMRDAASGELVVESRATAVEVTPPVQRS